MLVVVFLIAGAQLEGRIAQSEKSFFDVEASIHPCHRGRALNLLQPVRISDGKNKKEVECSTYSGNQHNSHFPEILLTPLSDVKFYLEPRGSFSM